MSSFTELRQDFMTTRGYYFMVQYQTQTVWSVYSWPIIQFCLLTKNSCNIHIRKHSFHFINLDSVFYDNTYKMDGRERSSVTWLFSTEAVCLSHMALISIPLSRSLSPCRKNSSIILSVHCRYNGNVLVGLLRSAQCTMFWRTWT